MDHRTQTNKQLLATIFDGLARGDSKPFRDSLADDFCWTVPGSNAWSGRYCGKEAVLRDLMRPLFANFATPYRNRAHRIVGEGEWVAVECEGEVLTKSGKPYNNRYCWLCRVVDGRLQEVIEYMDTELAAAVLSK